eukprot:gene10794-biopygen8383
MHVRQSGIAQNQCDSIAFEAFAMQEPWVPLHRRGASVGDQANARATPAPHLTLRPGECALGVSALLRQATPAPRPRHARATPAPLAC